MSNLIVMPKLGLTMESGVIIRWIKKAGETVKRGDAIAEVESDKSTVELESEFEGVFLECFFPEGSTVPCGKPLAAIGAEGEKPPAVNPREASETGVSANGSRAGDMDSGKKEGAPCRDSGRVIASPRARRFARNHKVELPEVRKEIGCDRRIEERDVKGFLRKQEGVRGRAVSISPLARKLAEDAKLDVSGLNGGGPGGRIMRDDVLGALGGQQSSPRTSGEKRPPAAVSVSKVRGIIAKRLTEAASTIPHFYLTLSMNMEELLRARASFNSRNRDSHVSLNAILIKMLSVTLRKHPEVNASWNDSNILVYPNIDVGLAVATNAGVITPVVRDCQDKDARGMDIELEDLIARARDGKLTMDEYQNATFTLSNLGMFGIEEFTAIINPPASAILAVGCIADTPVAAGGGIVLKPMMKVTLSADHRVLDGAAAAAFLKDLKDAIEFPFFGYF